MFILFFVVALAERNNEKPGTHTQRVPGESRSTMLPQAMKLVSDVSA